MCSQATYNPVLDSTGKPCRIVKLALDVTPQPIDAQRTRAALDQTDSPVMMVDPDGWIVYLNDAARALMRQKAGEIRSRLPQFDSNHIVGVSFDSCHMTPSRPNAMLPDPHGSHRAELRVGAAAPPRSSVKPRARRPPLPATAAGNSSWCFRARTPGSIGTRGADPRPSRKDSVEPAQPDDQRRRRHAPGGASALPCAAAVRRCRAGAVSGEECGPKLPRGVSRA